MGNYYRQVYTGPSEILDGSCSGLENVTVYADYDDTMRDIESAQSFFKGMYPTCQVPIVSDENYTKWLFNQGGSALNTQCAGPSKNVILGTIGGDPTRMSTTRARAIGAISDSVSCCRPHLCASKRRADGSCTLNDVPTKWQGDFYAYYDGPLLRADFVAEYLQLLYLNNMSFHETTDLSPVDLASLVGVHQAGLRVTENMFAAQAFGSQLMRHIVATVGQLVFGTTDASLASRPTDRLVAYFAHDINIYFLRSFLRLNWITDSFNLNQAPPGGILLFEIHKKSVGGKPVTYIKTFFQTQSYTQQRQATPLNAQNRPDRVFVAIPGCVHGPDSGCPVETFMQIALAAIDQQCITPIVPPAKRFF